MSEVLSDICGATIKLRLEALFMRYRTMLLIVAIFLCVGFLYYFLGTRPSHIRLKDTTTIQRGLESGVKKERLEALNGLANLTERQYIPFLSSCLNDDDAAIRLAASTALTRMRVPSGYNELIRLLLANETSILGDQTIGEGAAALLLFFQIDTFPALVEHLNDEDERIREKVFEVIATIAALHNKNVETFNYDPRASEEERLKGIARIGEWGREHVNREDRR